MTAHVNGTPATRPHSRWVEGVTVMFTAAVKAIAIAGTGKNWY